MPDGLGNETQVRVIAEQLFATWKAEQELEAKANRRWLGGNTPAWIGIAVLIVSAITAGGRTYDLANDAHARTVQNEKAIEAVKADNGDRLARIETKIDLMMEERRR